MPADALTGPYAQQQKLLLYVLPVVFAVGGIAFPIGVLFYWTTSNLWTMGQQFYVIRNNPAPGTPAVQGQAGPRPGQGARKGVPAPGRPHGRGPSPRSRRPRASASSPRSRRARSARSPAERRRPPRRAPGPAPARTPRGRHVPSNPQHRSRHDRAQHRRASPEHDLPTRPPSRRRDRGPDDREADRGRRPTTGRAPRPRTPRTPTTRPTTRATPTSAPSRGSRVERLENEGDIAADYLEELLDIADLDGDLDMDVEGDRAAVSIVGADLTQLVGAQRRGARRAAGADPAGGLPRDRRALAADAGHLRPPRARSARQLVAARRRDGAAGQGVRRAGRAASR